MGAVLFVLLLVVPVAELWVIVQVADEVGILVTLVLLLVISVAGAWLLKQQGRATYNSVQESLRRGEMPTKQVTDGALILLGGALLLTPGFLTDAVGLILLVPPTRGVVKNGARRLMGRWAHDRSRMRRSGTRHAKVVRVERHERTAGSPSSTPPSELGPVDRDDAGDSRDRA